MRNIITTVTLVLFTISLFAQNDSIKPQKKWHIYTSPLQAIDLFSIPKTTLGFEYIHNNTFGYSVEFGVKNVFDKIYGIDYDDDKTIKGKAFSARFEVKVYDKVLFMKNNFYSDYLGLEYRYLKSSYNELTRYYPDDGTDTEPLENDYITDYYGVKKGMHIINLKYGAIVNISEHFYIDIYAGFGLRHKQIENVEREFNYYDDYLDLGNHDFFTKHDLKEDSGNHYNISLGGKFGYRF